MKTLIEYCITCNGEIGKECINPVSCAEEMASCYGYDNVERVLSELYKKEHSDWEHKYKQALTTDVAPPKKDPNELPF